jgi:hypothetical protein
MIDFFSRKSQEKLRYSSAELTEDARTVSIYMDEDLDALYLSIVRYKL